MAFPEGMIETLLVEDPDKHGLFVKMVTITPEAAAKWLSFNHEHRKVKKTRVYKYADKMLEGEWKLTGKTIVFDKDGKLIGGQHRLAACVFSKVPFTTLVVCGVDPAVVEKDEEDE